MDFGFRENKFVFINESTEIKASSRRMRIPKKYKFSLHRRINTLSFSSIDKYPDNESRIMINRFVFS